MTATIDAIIPGTLAHRRTVKTFVIEAPPGAGKTSRVPRAHEPGEASKVAQVNLR